MTEILEYIRWGQLYAKPHQCQIVWIANERIDRSLFPCVQALFGGGGACLYFLAYCLVSHMRSSICSRDKDEDR